MLVVTAGAYQRANGTYRVQPGATVRFEQAWYAWGEPILRLDLLVVATPARLAASREGSATRTADPRTRVRRSRARKRSSSRSAGRHTSRRRCGAWG